MQKLLVSLILMSLVPLAHADDTANSVPNADQVDEVLTNANLRAMSGSKSRWSLSNSLNYNGGTLSSPFAEGRPNIAGASATSTDTDIDDQISIKLTLTPLDSLLFGVGVRKMAPFTGSGPSKAFYAQGGKDVDVYDPTLTYQHVYKWLGIQSVAQVSTTQYTRRDIHSSDGGNLDKNYGIDQENIYEIGNFSVGASIGAGYNTPTQNGVEYSKYQYWFDPYVEYKFNDTYNFRTVANCLSFESNAISGGFQDDFTQSVGVGISVTRDVYFYPNVQFLPEHLDKKLTNVGLSATINLF